MSAPANTPDLERGSSLAGSLLIILLMSFVVLGLVTDLRVAQRRSLNMEVRDQAHWYAMGARDYSELLISRALENPEAAFRPDAGWLTGAQIFPIREGQIAGRLRDGNNCFNLNSLVERSENGAVSTNTVQRARFERLLRALDVPANQTALIASQAIDWIDADQRPEAGGAEDPVYKRFDRPYRTANTLMAEREELLALEIMAPDIYRRIEDFVCVKPSTTATPLNLNTLQLDQAALLVAVLGEGVTRLAAENLLIQRPVAGYASVQEFWQSEPVQALQLDAAILEDLAISTQYFEVDIDVVYAGARYSLRETVRASGPGQVVRLTQRYGSFS